MTPITTDIADLPRRLRAFKLTETEKYMHSFTGEATGREYSMPMYYIKSRFDPKPLMEEAATALETANREIAELKAEGEEMGEIGERDGYDRAVQDIDLATGGDGEYRYCTNHDPERHCPDVETMKTRILERFETANRRIEELEAAMERIQDEANTVGPDWRETASMIDSICLATLQPKEQQP